MIDIAALKAMVAGGATAEQVLNAVCDAHAATEKAAEDRRARHAERMRRHRAKRDAHAKSVTRTRDAHAPSVEAPPPPAPTSSVQEQSVTRTVEKVHCDVITPTLFDDLSRKKERVSAEIVEGRKGTRLARDAVLSTDGRDFARSHQFSDDEITEMWAEFVDYWVGVPGQRGRKLDWPATWRNRVRDIAARRRGKNGQHRQAGNGHRGDEHLGAAALSRRRAAAAGRY